MESSFGMTLPFHHCAEAGTQYQRSSRDDRNRCGNLVAGPLNQPTTSHRTTWRLRFLSPAGLTDCLMGDMRPLSCLPRRVRTVRLSLRGASPSLLAPKISMHIALAGHSERKVTPVVFADFPGFIHAQVYRRLGSIPKIGCSH